MTMAALRKRRLALALAALGGLVAFLSVTELFPYRSLNHDEGVYLQQAAMLLEGQLYYRPPVPGAMRPWFFVVSEAGMYSKYAPPTAAIFALGKLLWSYELALVGVGAALSGLTYDVVARTFDDRRVGALAAVFLVCSPLFVVQSGTFLPYAPTTALNLGFAAAFLRADETGSPRWGALAGLCIGVAFFARPYTALLFAAPFIVAALADIARDLRHRILRGAVLRHGATAVTGLAGVAATLGYNAVVTGEALTFPYEAFAPRDGLGFGQRRLLGHELYYDLEIAIESNRLAVETLLTDWVVAGRYGAVLAAFGAGVVLLRTYRSRTPSRGKALLAGVFGTVVAGNLYFWGTFNTLGDLGNPDDGLIHFLGPYYHFDTLVPIAAFAAVGAVALAGWVVRRVDYWLPERRRAALSLLAAVALVVFVGAAGGALAEPVEDNSVITGEYEAAYEPLDDPPENAVVFVPDTYGPWLNHPFQHLRNDPDFDSGPVYALDYDEENFEVVDAFPERDLYRYGYRGIWNPVDGYPVEPKLQPVEAVTGERVTHSATVGLPEAAQSVTVRVAVEGGEAAHYAADPDGTTLPLELTLEDGRAALSGPVSGNRTLAVSGETEVELVVFVDRGPGNRLSYRFTVPVVAEEGQFRTLTPDIEACRVARRCGGAAAYVADSEELPGWASVETDVRVQNGSASRTRSLTQTRTMERAISQPPVSGSSVVSPSRSPYAMGVSRTS